MVRQFIIPTVVILLVGCTPGQQVTPTARPLTVANSGLVYTPLTAKRIADTRPSSGYQWAGHTLRPDAAMMLRVTGSGMAPVGAGAVVLTVTAMGGTAAGSLTVYRAGITPPNTSTVSWGQGETASNLVTVKVGTGGQVALANTAGSVDVVVDLNGYYARPAGSTGAGHYFPVAPFRLLDTRESNPIGPGASAPIKVADTAVPPAAEAAVLNVTAVDTTERSYLAVVPGTLQCPASGPDPCIGTWSFTWAAGTAVTNRVIAPLGRGPDGSPGWISLFNLAGSTDLQIDVEGWYADSTVPASMGSTFFPIDPCRVLGRGLQPAEESPVSLVGVCGVPVGSTAVVVNATVSETAASGDLAIQPWLSLKQRFHEEGHDVVRPTQAPLSEPFASCMDQSNDYEGSLRRTIDLTWRAGRPVGNLDQLVLGPTGAVFLPMAGRLTLDVSGYFTSGPGRSRLLCVSVEADFTDAPRLSWRIAGTVFDMRSDEPVPGDIVKFAVTPMPGSAVCSDDSLLRGNQVTDKFGSASVVYRPADPGICLITAHEQSGASSSIAVANRLLELAPGSGSSTIVVTATYLRSDRTPHSGAALDFKAIVNSLGGAPVAQGKCVTDGSGQCSFSYRLGVSPAGYYGSTIVFVQDSAGLQVSTLAQGV